MAFIKNIELTTRLLEKYKNVIVVNPRDWLCDDDYCYASIGNKFMYEDKNHLNVNGSMF